MIKHVGDIIREKREEKGMLLRHLAAKLDIDQALLSKIERGKRKATKEQIINLSSLLDFDNKELIIQYHSDNIVKEIGYEEVAVDILHVAETKVIYIRNHIKED